MITEKDLQEAIAECKGQRNPTANTCIKLAAYYIIKEHMYPDDVCPVSPSYSFASAPDLRHDEVKYSSDTEFWSLIDGRDFNEILPIIDDAMSTLSVVNPKLYKSVIRRLT